MSERCLIGWESMAEMFQKRPGYCYQWKGELYNLGLIWYQRPGSGYKDSRGKTITKPMVHFFPSEVRSWHRLKRQKGEL